MNYKIVDFCISVFVSKPYYKFGNLYTLEYNTYEYKEVIYVFYGRKQELKTLEKEYLKKNSLCSIYGARRIGKTSLISEFIKDKKSISQKENSKMKLKKKLIWNTLK